MPDPNALKALEMLEYCRFAYKAYAQSCVYPMDPFYEGHGEGKWQGGRDRVMAHVHELRGSRDAVCKFDPILYKLGVAPYPRDGVVYRGGTGKDPYILFQPREIDMSIYFYKGVDLMGEDIWPNPDFNPGGTLRCCHFQGLTGMTKTHDLAGWPSWLGAAIYDKKSESMVIVFRGSRSGSGGRALYQALTQSCGSPDWVTDMNHLKAVKVGIFDGARLSAGFWLAYRSCRKSLEAAFGEAMWHHPPPKAIYFTGHSLGGALAQCAYLDMKSGHLFGGSGSLSKRLKQSYVCCYAISAPPVILGDDSVKKVMSKIGEANIFHYFASKDAVHDSSAVKTSVLSSVNKLIATSTHPLMSPRHLGEEIRLTSSGTTFPDAHEPEVVFKGLVELIKAESKMGLSKDPGFWPLLQLDIVGGKPQCALNWDGGKKDAQKALVMSSLPGVVQERAGHWATVVKGSKQDDYESLDDTDGEIFELFHEIERQVQDLGNPFSDDEDRKQARLALQRFREPLLKAYGGASSHKASSAVAWTILQFISARWCAFSDL